MRMCASNSYPFHFKNPTKKNKSSLTLSSWKDSVNNNEGEKRKSNHLHVFGITFDHKVNGKEHMHGIGEGDFNQKMHYKGCGKEG